MDLLSSPRDVFADAVREGGGLHSALYLWLYEHHDAVASERARHRVTWEALAKQFALRGLRHRNGGEPSAASLRLTWSRVRRAVLRDRTREAGQAVNAGRMTTGDHRIVSARGAVDLPGRETAVPVEHHPAVPRAASESSDEAGVMMLVLEDHAGVTADVPAACAGPGQVPGVAVLPTTGGGGDDAAPPGRSPEGEDGSTPRKKGRLMW